MRILAVSGSLRAGSSNTAVLQAIQTLAAPGVEVVLYDGLGALPHFNPDQDGADPPAAVLALRRQVGAADDLLISSPEYARGMPGSLKNALDWLVGSAEFPDKPVALVNTSPRATHAQAALVLTLTTMSARLVETAFVTLPLLGASRSATDIAADPEMAHRLRTALDRFVRAVAARPEPQ